MKICTKCGEGKQPSEFRLDKRDGIRSRCRVCENAQNKAYRDANPEKTKASYLKYRTAHPDRVKAKDAAYVAANPEKVRAKNARWVACNRERVRENNATWAKANLQKGRVYSGNRRALKRNAGGKLTHGLEVKLFNLQKGKCPCCALPLGTDYHIDHRMPLALGGSNTDDNMQLLRNLCNRQKHAKHPNDFMRERGFLI